MKDLSRKLDQFPQDFDRETIWEGIEKPGAPFFWRAPFWIFFLLLLTILVGVSIYYLDGTYHPESEQPSRSAAVGPHDYSNIPLVDLLDTISAGRNSLGEGSDKAQSGAVFPIRPEGKPTQPISRIENTATQKVGADSLAASSERALNALSLDRRLEQSLESSRRFSDIPPLRASVALLKKERVERAITGYATAPENTEIPNQSLALRVGVGAHRAMFSSPNAEALRWRSDFEEPQLDFTLGVRYTHRLNRKNVLLSVSAHYALYKEKVLNTHTQYLPDREVQIDYKLHNHYHTFSSQAEIGKRFDHRAFFWEVWGGGGIKFAQATDADYFIAEDELAAPGQVDADYETTRDLFFTAHAAVGKNLSRRLFIRIGTQFNSALDLTGPQSAIRHQVVPVQAFLELGARF